MTTTGTLVALSRKGSVYQAHYEHQVTRTVHHSHPVYTGNESMGNGKLLVSRTYRMVSTVERTSTETAVYEVSEEEARDLAEQIKSSGQPYSISRLAADEWAINVLESE